MSGFQFSTDEVYPGPWLLDQNALKGLDLIVLKHWEIFETRRLQLLNLAYEERLDISTHNINEQLSLFSESLPPHLLMSYLEFHIRYYKSIYKCDKFEDAFRERLLSQQTPNGFKIEFCSGDISGTVDLDVNDGLSVRLEPEDLQEVQDIFIDLEEWVSDNRPSFWQRVWGKVADVGFRLHVFVIIAILGIALVINLIAPYQSGLIVKAGAQKFIDQSVSDSNLLEAVTFLLQAQVLNSNTLVFPPWFKISLLFLVLLMVIIPIRPKVVLGIGKGKTYIKLWRIWQKVVLFSIPTSILKFIYSRVLNS